MLTFPIFTDDIDTSLQNDGFAYDIIGNCNSIIALFWVFLL